MCHHNILLQYFKTNLNAEMKCGSAAKQNMEIVVKNHAVTNTVNTLRKWIQEVNTDIVIG
jgi:polysaccharide deacetylase 2 family uncharacterized protein YibQ